MIQTSGLRILLLQIAAPVVLGWVLISSLQSALFPPPPQWSRSARQHGQLTLKLKLPGTSAGIAEPIVSVGRAGSATLVFIRLLPQSQAKVGVEFWGIGAWESDSFPLPAQDAMITVTTSFPALYPDEEDSLWNWMPVSTKTHLLTHYAISVEGIPRLSGVVKYKQEPNQPRYLGSNPLGGSLVSVSFTGQLLESWQAF